MFALIACTLKQKVLGIAGTLFLITDSDATAYFSTPFTVFTDNAEAIEVLCEIICDGRSLSQVTAVATNLTEIAVPVPGYSGACLARVSAFNWDTAENELSLLNYTTCSTQTLTSGSFSSGNALTIPQQYLQQGPLGRISIEQLKLDTSSLPLNSFFLTLTSSTAGGDNSLIVYKSSCTEQFSEIDMKITDSGRLSLSACSEYNSSLTFKPFEPFSTFYGGEAVSSFSFTFAISFLQIFQLLRAQLNVFQVKFV